MTTSLAEPDPQLLAATSFGAVFRYSPCGVSPVARRSRQYCNLLKARDPAFLAYGARCVRLDVMAGGVLSDLFAARPTLVPVPPSGRSPRGTPTVAGALSAALILQGLGSGIAACLERRCDIGRSCRARPGKRASVREHYLSLAVITAPGQPADILLVDDLVTKGRTLIAATARLREAFPGSRVSTFALMRTLSLVADIESLRDPCVGQIRWVRGDARRIP